MKKWRIDFIGGATVIINADQAVSCANDYLKFSNGWFIFESEVAGFKKDSGWIFFIEIQE